MLDFEDSYFEPEVRDGFYVPSMMKMAWAVELDVLSEVDRICQKYGITYWVEYGTLLGAVRHHGFIPWDDDLDIGMKRADYERFLQIAEQELPEGFAVLNFRNTDYFMYFLSRIVAKNRICFEEEYLKQAHNFPYIAGLDLFVYDYISADSEREKQRDDLMRYVLAVADQMELGVLQGAELEKQFGRIETLCHTQLDRGLDVQQSKRQLYYIVENLRTVFQENESNTISRIIPDVLDSGWYGFPKEYYGNTVRIPFENVEVPVHVMYDTFLKADYGDYMLIMKMLGVHNYPFYETQRKNLQDVLDFDIPQYRFQEKELERKSPDKKWSIKSLIQDYIQYLSQFEQDYRRILEKKTYPLLEQLLPECQQITIEAGSLIEKWKGEGTRIVSQMEAFCEQLYQIFEQHIDSKVVEHGFEKLADQISQMIRMINQDILERKEVVFLPYHASQWSYLKNYYKEEIQDAACDVYVIPIPYYYKEYDGRLCNMCLETEEFPQELMITDWQSFDFELHQPDRIYIQNPYDEWNPAISIDPLFYSSRLQEYTEQLIYVPPFTVEEFTKDHDREFYNMQFYVTVPGVVRADYVWVQSENMRQVYIEKLVQFAGEQTRARWESKIQSAKPGMELEKNSVNIEMLPFSDIEKEKLLRAKENGQVCLLYTMNANDLIENGEQAIEKLQHILDMFYEKQEQVFFIWKPDALIDKFFGVIEEEIKNAYQDIVKGFCEQNWGIYAEQLEEGTAGLLVDAFYGSSGALAKACQLAGKPALIQNVEWI